jgi:hypothetical protein
MGAEEGMEHIQPVEFPLNIGVLNTLELIPEGRHCKECLLYRNTETTGINYLFLVENPSFALCLEIASGRMLIASGATLVPPCSAEDLSVIGHEKVAISRPCGAIILVDEGEYITIARPIAIDPVENEKTINDLKAQLI